MVDPVVPDAARTVAEAQFQLQRVLESKRALVRREKSGRTGGDADALSAAEIPAELLHNLQRYDRRAFSRRKSASGASRSLPVVQGARGQRRSDDARDHRAGDCSAPVT